MDAVFFHCQTPFRRSPRNAKDIRFVLHPTRRLIMSDSQAAPQGPPPSAGTLPVSGTGQLPPELHVHKPSIFPRFALFFGPFMYLTLLLLPIGDSTVTQRGGVGIVLWAAWYWSTGCVPSGYVLAVPIFGTAFLPDMKFGEILKTLIHPGLPMLLGPALIVCMWSRWGFTRRMALYVLSKVGTSVRAQAVTWLLLAASISFITANVVIAIALTPIVLEALKSVGYDTAAKLRGSKSAMLVIIAVGIGSTVGGFLTPMAGGQAVITWQELCRALGYPVSMGAFAATMALPIFLSLIPVAILFGFVFPVDSRHFSGSADYFRKQLAQMGPLSRAELWGVVIFLFAIALPFLEPFWRPLIPARYDLSPGLIFATVTLILALIPAPDRGAHIKPFAYARNERLLSMNSLRILPLQAFLMWPTAMSMAVLVDMTGASSLVTGAMGSYWDLPPYAGVGLMVLTCVILGNIASDTAAAGMLAPVIGAAAVAAGQNPVPWLLMMGFSVNFSFMVPCACGTIALPIALEGKASWRLPVYGFFCALCCGIVAWLFWGTVLAEDLGFWLHFNRL